MPKRYQETGFVRYLTEQEFNKIASWVDLKLRNAISTRVCFKVLMYMGLRPSEAISLQRDNFSKDFSELIFRPLKRKNYFLHKRKVPAILQVILKEYWEKYQSRIKKRSLTYLFPPMRNCSKNEHLKISTLHSWCSKMRKDLKIDDVYYIRKDGNKLFRLSAHTFRHYVAWKLYDVSKDLKAVQQIIGHKKIETTAGYIDALKSRSYDFEQELINKAFT